MSEQNEREKAEMRVRIAGDMVECRLCVDGKIPTCRCGDTFDEWAVGGGCRDCSGEIVLGPHTKCKGTGRVYRFSDALRAPCGICGGDPGLGGKPCYTGVLGQPFGCQGRGWIVPEGFGWLLLKELDKAGINYSLMRDYVSVWEHGSKPQLPLATEGDPEAALYRKVCAVVEAATDPDEGLEVRPEVEEHLLGSLHTPREGLLSPKEAWRRHDEAAP